MCDFEKSTKQIHQSFCGSHISWSLDLKQQEKKCVDEHLTNQLWLIIVVSMQKGALCLHLSCLHPPIRLFFTPTQCNFFSKYKTDTFQVSYQKHLFPEMCNEHGCVNSIRILFVLFKIFQFCNAILWP